MFRLKPARKKRPIAVTLIAWAIFILFLVRLYQAIEPLFNARIFETGLSGPLFDGLHLTPLGSALLTSTVYSLLSLSGIVVLVVPAHETLELDCLNGVDGHFTDGFSAWLLLRTSKLHRHGIRYLHCPGAQPGRCSAYF